MPPPPDHLVVRLRAAGCVFAEDEAALLTEEASGERLEALVVRRVAGEPLEQVLGWAAFCGLRIRLDPGIFVPRRRTGLMVRQALAQLAGDEVVVDLCCGAGAVGAALLATYPRLDLHAADVDPAAVACARRNLPADRVHPGDLYDALPTVLQGRVRVLAANTPYVPTGAIATMPPEARDHEPAIALDGGADGLAVARRVAAGAGDWLVSGGVLLVETSEEQAPVLAEVFEDAGLVPRVVTAEDLDATLVIGAR